MDPAKNFVKDDTIILQAKVEADAPHGIKLVQSCDVFSHELHVRTLVCHTISSYF